MVTSSGSEINPARCTLMNYIPSFSLTHSYNPPNHCNCSPPPPCPCVCLRLCKPEAPYVPVPEQATQITFSIHSRLITRCIQAPHSPQLLFSPSLCSPLIPSHSSTTLSFPYLCLPYLPISAFPTYLVLPTPPT